MKGKKNRFVMWILTFMVLGIGISYPKMLAFAGGINGNEARVIAAASGTFSYNGKTYRAGSAYINSLTSYLSGDDVDLTASQADEAISTMYASVAEGVEQGYLYEVGGDSTTEDSNTEQTTEKDGTSEESGEQADGMDTSETHKKDTDKENSTSENPVSEVNVWDTMSSETEAKEKLKQRPDKEEAEVLVGLEGKDIVITTRDNETIRFSREEQIISDSVLYVLDGIAGALLGITILCGGILSASRCMTFRKRRDRKARPGHSKRRKIRHNTRAVLTVTTAVSILGFLLLLCIYAGLFNKNALIQNMQSSGYFRYAYSEYAAGVTDELYSDEQNNGTNTEEQAVSYEDYLFTIKQNSLKVLDGKTDIIIPDSNVTPYIYNLKTGYNKLFSVAGICMVLNVIIGIFLMVFMDQRRERGLKHTAAAVLAAGACMALLTVVMAVKKPYLHFYVEPDYLYLFLMECIKRCVMIMACVTAFAVVLGMILTGAYKSCTGKGNS